MDIIESTHRFEVWLRRQIPVVEADLIYKHEQMRTDPFLFFRATFYRWAQLWPKQCPKLARAHEVMAVGDLHLENFGIWRDAEGRLVWGVNDFDEAHPIAFTNDLVRLAVSALLSLHVQPTIKLTQEMLFDKLIEGYRAALEAGGEPFVLMERHHKMREMATQQLRQPSEFWPRLETKVSKPIRDLPRSLCKAFQKILPKDVEPSYLEVTKPKGLGSLGRRRYLAKATWQGGLIAREGKDAVPSAYCWASGLKTGKGNPWLNKTVKAAVRCADPYYQVDGRWLVRRLAPDCSRIDIEELKHHSDFASLLYCMGWETANIHLGSPKAGKVLIKSLDRLPKEWLSEAVETMFKKTLKDWGNFQSFRQPSDK
jgi:hypothetical protein